MLQILHLPLSNVYLLTGEKSVLVDAGRPGDAARILSFLRSHAIGPPEKLALILPTHGHWDHAGAAAQLRAETKAPIALHRADADFVRRGVNGPLKPTNLLGRLMLPFLDRSYPGFEPDLLIDEEIDLQQFGVAARILFTPGHTAGSISVITAEREAIIGDLLMGGIWGGCLFPRRPGLHYYADDLDQLQASVEKVLAVSPRTLHPGHGGPLDPQDVAHSFSARSAPRER